MNVSHGRLLLERELKRLGVGGVSYEKIARDLGFANAEEMQVAIGCGDIHLNKIISKVVEEKEEEFGFAEILETVPSPDVTTEDVSILGLSGGLLSRMAKCCKPAPGDPIVGYITRGRGATVHRQDCPNVLRIKDRERLVQVSWGRLRQTYPVSVRLRAYDRDGLMRDVSTLVANEGINMSSINVSTKNSLAMFNLVIQVTDIEQLSRILNRLEALPNVLEARRFRPG